MTQLKCMISLGGVIWLGIKRLAIRAKVRWDRLSPIIGGVIRALEDRGRVPEITIDIKAEADHEFHRTTLNTKVKEPLKQIEAQIEEWKEVR